MAMRWLTREWQSGALSGGEREARWQAYLDHRDVTSIHLPPALHRLAAVDVDGSITLHRAVPEWWALEDGKALTLSVITGDDGHAPDAGPQRIVLQYLGNLELVDTNADQLDNWLGVDGGHLLYDEIEVLPGRRFEQRFLLSPDGELTVRFDSVLLVSAPTTAAERDALLARRSSRANQSVEAPTPTVPAAATPTSYDAPALTVQEPVAPAAAVEPVSVAGPIADGPTVVISDPPEGAPAPVPDATSEALVPAPGKRTLRDTLLSWLPGVRGTRT